MRLRTWVDNAGAALRRSLRADTLSSTYRTSDQYSESRRARAARCCGLHDGRVAVQRPPRGLTGPAAARHTRARRSGHVYKAIDTESTPRTLKMELRLGERVGEHSDAIAELTAEKVPARSAGSQASPRTAGPHQKSVLQSMRYQQGRCGVTTDRRNMVTARATVRSPARRSRRRHMPRTAEQDQYGSERVVALLQTLARALERSAFGTAHRSPSRT